MFRHILDALEEDLLLPEQQSRLKIRDRQFFLLRALDYHEELEVLIFKSSLHSTFDGGQAVWDQIRVQHRDVTRVGANLLSALEFAKRCPFPILADLTHTLIDFLRRHLETEEKNFGRIIAK